MLIIIFLFSSYLLAFVFKFVLILTRVSHKMLPGISVDLDFQRKIEGTCQIMYEKPVENIFVVIFWGIGVLLHIHCM